VKPTHCNRLAILTFSDRFSKIIVNGIPEAKEWIAVRQTKNYQSNSGVTSVTSPDMRCFQNRAGTSTATVVAGAELGFVAETSITHFGPVQFYMAKVPDSADINSYDPSGNVWFKAASISAQGSPLGSGTETWPAYRACSTFFYPLFSHVLSASLTPVQKSQPCPSPSPRTRHLASISCVSSPLHCIKRKTSVVHRCICLARRLRLRAAEMGNQGHLLHFLVPIARTTRG
jgi:hypothetical protein